MRLAHLGLLAVVAGLPRAALAAPGAGTPADPIVVDALPYALASTTSGAGSEIDSYDCAPGTDESGPELVFSFQLVADARVTAFIEEAGSVDVDVHLLDDLSLSGGVASGCVSRGNKIAEAQMTSGNHYVVVDSFQGSAQAGDFVLRMYAIGDAWTEQSIAQGVVWRARRYADQSGGSQVVNELVIDGAATGVSLKAFAASGCQTVATLGAAHQAVAGINGGYFGTAGGCPPVSLLKSGGQLIGTNGSKRGSFGVSSTGQSMIEIVSAGVDWPAATEAHGGGPILVKAGATTASSDWAAESITNASFIGPNPRTWVGIDSSGMTHFGTVDGRRKNAAGMSLGSMASWLASSEIGVVDAVNLDGGGSSQMWIAGATPNGVVNYPSDNANAEEPTHAGSRACSGGMFVFAPPYNHPPRFQTTPTTDASAGTPYTYDADAIDLDVDDILTFSLTQSPAGMTVDATTGVVSWTPSVTDAASVPVDLVVSDDGGEQTTQSFVISVSGTVGPPDAGAAGASNVDGGGAGTGGGAGSAGSGAAPDNVDGGCGCRTREPRGTQGAPWLVLVMLGLWRRRRTLFR